MRTPALRFFCLLLLAVALLRSHIATNEPERYDGWSREQCISSDDYSSEHFLASLTQRPETGVEKHKNDDRDPRAATCGTVIKFLLDPHLFELAKVPAFRSEPAPPAAILPNLIRGPPRSAVSRSV